MNENRENYGRNLQKGRHDNVQPVSKLHPYQNAWQILVRCTNKDAVRHYSNERGDGHFFCVDLLDAEGTEIKALAFNEIADKLFDAFQKNGVYLISKFQVRLARKGYNYINNDYSITLNLNTVVVPVKDDNDIAAQKYSFTAIKQIQKMEPKSFVDIIGIVIDVSDTQKVRSSKTGKEINKRTVKIADQTAQIEMTIWNKDALEYPAKKLKDAVIAIKGCRINAYGGTVFVSTLYLLLQLLLYSELNDIQ